MKTASTNIFLIGLMGAGKTTVGRQLAQHLQRSFFDSDLVIIERTGVSIPTIFEVEGEQGFRNRETAVIDELSALQGIILATGGGAVMRAENRAMLQQRGLVVYLHATPKVLLERTRYDKNRPLLQVADPLEKLNELYALRDPVYREAADYIVEAGFGGSQKTAAQIQEILQQRETSCAN